MKCRGIVQPRLLVVWGVLGLLAIAIAAVEMRNRSIMPEEVAQKVHGAEGSRMLLPAPIEALSLIEVGYAGAMHRFERDAKGVWFYHGAHSAAQAGHEHQTDSVQSQLIDKAFAALARTRMERQLQLDVQPGAYGFSAPQMVILVYSQDNPLPLAQFAVGDVAPDGISRYVLKVGSSFAVTIANYQIDNLIGLVGAVSKGTALPSVSRKTP